MTTTAPDVFTGGQEALTTEEATNATWQYAPGTVPGLLQTPGYATAVANSLPHLDRGRQDHFRLRIEPVLHGRPHVGRREQLGIIPASPSRTSVNNPRTLAAAGTARLYVSRVPASNPAGASQWAGAHEIGVSAYRPPATPATRRRTRFSDWPGPAQDAAAISS